jgi:Ankyrin repeats (3 copies)/Ankyrin repeat
MNKAVLLLLVLNESIYCNSFSAVNSHKKALQELIYKEQQEAESNRNSAKRPREQSSLNALGSFIDLDKGVNEDRASLETEISELTDKKVAVSNYSTWAAALGITGLLVVYTFWGKYVRSLLPSSGNQDNGRRSSSGQNEFDDKKDRKPKENASPPGPPAAFDLMDSMEASSPTRTPNLAMVPPDSLIPAVADPFAVPVGKQDNLDPEELGRQLIDKIQSFDTDITEIEKLIRQGANINVQGKGNQSNTSLHVAVVCGNIEVISLLLKQGIDIDIRNAAGMTPLHMAAFYGRKEAIGLLLDGGVDIHAKDNDGRTPLHWAVCGNQKEIAKLLLEQSADINVQNDIGYTPLHAAVCSNDKIGIIRLFLDHTAIDVNLRENKYKRTPFELAQSLNKIEIVNLFSEYLEKKK